MTNPAKRRYVGASLSHDEYAQTRAIADMEADSLREGINRV